MDFKDEGEPEFIFRIAPNGMDGVYPKNKWLVRVAVQLIEQMIEEKIDKDKTVEENIEMSLKVAADYIAMVLGFEIRKLDTKRISRIGGKCA